MKNRKAARLAIPSLVLAFCVSATAAEEKPKGDLLAPPAVDVVRKRVEQWLAGAGAIAPETRKAIEQRWNFGDGQPTTDELLQQTIDTFRAVDAEAKALVESCRFRNAPLMPPDAKFLQSDGLDPFYTNNLRLYYGRYLTQRRMYEEGLAVLGRVNVSEVIDPGSCLFFTAVCQHHLLMKDEGLATIKQLTTRTQGVPPRYATVATLMQYDLESLKSKSLDEISRKMLDVERRLDLGRSGQKVQKVEDEIIAGLDDIIKKIEQQMGGGGGGGGKNDKNGSAKPAEDSRVKGAKAEGNVDNKKLKSGGKWGVLDDKLRSRVKQYIGREFPTHYRRAVEEYFRNAAKRTAP